MVAPLNIARGTQNKILEGHGDRRAGGHEPRRGRRRRRRGPGAPARRRRARRTGPRRSCASSRTRTSGCASRVPAARACSRTTHGRSRCGGWTGSSSAACRPHVRCGPCPRPPEGGRARNQNNHRDHRREDQHLRPGLRGRRVARLPRPRRPRVIGVDVDPAKLDLIRAGKTPVVEEGMVDLMAKVAASGRVHVTSDAREAVRRSELSLVCVGTPSAANGSQDQSAMLESRGRSGTRIGAKAGRPRRRVPLDARARHGRGRAASRSSSRASGKKHGRDFHVCFQPEFLREGCSIRDYDKPPFTIVGAQRRAVGRGPA